MLRVAMRATALLVTLVLVACREAPPAPVATARALRPPPPAGPTLPLPPPLDNTGVSMRLLVLGDGGARSPGHDLAFDSARALLHDAERAGVPVLVLMPGDLTYDTGLPATCPEARARLEEDYLSVLPGARFVVVAGNHDHANPGADEHPEIARRHAYFDCAYTRALAGEQDWDPAACTCETNWEYPGGGSDVGTRELVAPGPDRVGLTLVTYDSQSALARPLAVAYALAQALDAVPNDRRLLVMAHHPWRTLGAHGRPDSVRPQDLASPPYRAMLAALRPVIEGRRARIALGIFGHDHDLEFSPGPVPELVSGAAAKASAVRAPAPPGAFAMGDSPGLTAVDLRKDGALTLTFVSDAPPARFDLPALPPAPERDRDVAADR